MWLRRKSLLEHFLYNTTAAWAFLFDDDNDYAPHNYARMLESFEDRYNTEKQLIIIGQRLGNELVGGGGFVVSRKFAQFYLDIFEHEMTTMHEADDNHLTRIAKKYALRPDMFLGKYAAQLPAKTTMLKVIQKNYSSFPKCRHIANKRKFEGTTIPRKLSELFSVHNHEFLHGYNWEEISKEIPKELTLYYRKRVYLPCICFDDYYPWDISRKLYTFYRKVLSVIFS